MPFIPAIELVSFLYVISKFFDLTAERRLFPAQSKRQPEICLCSLASEANIFLIFLPSLEVYGTATIICSTQTVFTTE